MTTQQTSDISAIVCTKNCDDLIEDCLKSIANNNLGEIIIIDGKSTDRTLEIAKKYTDVIYSDEGKGLAYARQLGAEKAKGAYIAYIGPDNVLGDNSLDKMLDEMINNGYVGIQPQILIQDSSSYWDRGMNNNLIITHNKVEERDVIGTPCLFDKSVIVAVKYDPSITFGADDTDLCLRLKQKGYRLGISSVLVYEKRHSTFVDFSKRWMWYGMGDAQFIVKHRNRILISITHPLRSYMIRRVLLAVKNNDFNNVPFFFLCGFFRYVGIARGFGFITKNYLKRIAHVQ